MKFKKLICFIKGHDWWPTVSKHLNEHGAENLPRIVKCERCKKIIDLLKQNCFFK